MSANPAGLPGGFLESGGGPARRLWHAEEAPGAALAEAGRGIGRELPPEPGRVHGQPCGFDGIGERLQAALPQALRTALRDRFDWYACRGAHFHTDSHFDDVLFGVWCVAGPVRDLLLPRAGFRLRMVHGAIAVFDPFEPHAVLDPGRERYDGAGYRGTEANVFVGFELELSAPMRALFGIVDEVPQRATRLSSRVAVNAETGALPD